MNQFRSFAGLITFILIITRATKIHGAKDIFFPEEIMPGSECTSNTVCLAVNMCDTLNIRQSRPQICGWIGKNPMVCCPKKFVKIVDRSECATVENTRSGIQKRGSLVSIVRGKYSKKGSRPWMAAIFVKERPSRKSVHLHCGGSLISSNSVLTAAHCFINTDETNRFVVVLGDLKLGDDIDGLTPVEVDVSRVISHEGYKYPLVYNDIAILKLATTVNFTPNIRMICLPDATFRNFNLDNQNALIAGWGHLKFGGAFSPALQEASVPIVDNSQCDQVYKTVLEIDNDILPKGITKDVICAGDDKEKKDACQGDSGGPLVYDHKETNNWILIGIIASGYECGRGVPGLYTRVSEYLDWIGSHNN